MIIQLFNWFSKRRLGIALGFWMAAQSFGLMTKFASMNVWAYLPNWNLAIQGGVNAPVLQHFAYLLFIVGSLFVVIGIQDWYLFIFHPFELGIVIDVQEKRQQDQAFLRKLELEAQLISQKQSVGLNYETKNVAIGYQQDRERQ